MLAIHNLHIRYGENRAVRDFSLYVRSGEIVTLVGPTGCGKSSILRAVAGLRRPEDGEIVIDGLCTCGERFVPPEKRRTGLVFQDFALFPHLSVERNIGFRVKDPEEAEKWMRALDLTAFREAMPETLSGGQKQRVALARSLAHRPKLLLLDEPLSNLDAAMKTDLRAQIRDAIRRAGVTAVWVTHDQDEAMGVGDRIAIMRDGNLEQIDSPENCYEAPASRFVASFLGKGRFLAGETRGNKAHTTLGTHPVFLTDAKPDDTPQTRPVDVLLRPHDVALTRKDPGNCVVQHHRYEGGTRLYTLRLDSGESVEARLNHECLFADGERAHASVGAGHRLAAFPAEDSADRQS